MFFKKINTYDDEQWQQCIILSAFMYLTYTKLYDITLGHVLSLIQSFSINTDTTRLSLSDNSIAERLLLHQSKCILLICQAILNQLPCNLHTSLCNHAATTLVCIFEVESFDMFEMQYFFTEI